MKLKKIKILTIIFIIVISIFATGCSNSDKKTENLKEPELGYSTNETVDLTKLSSTMVYAEVYNMMSNPDDYIGKEVKMSGPFVIFEDPETGNIFTACLIQDAAGCCAQGLEFILSGDTSYPDDYPKLESEITVTGTFQTYTENDYLFCHLVNATLTDKN